MRGTPKAYEMLLASPEKPNVDTLYFISEADSTNAVLYLGEKLIAGGGSTTKLTLSELTDIALSTDLADKSILVYDTASGKWIDSTLEQAISVFIGASADAAGKAGLFLLLDMEKPINFYVVTALGHLLTVQKQLLSLLKMKIVKSCIKS